MKERNELEEIKSLLKKYKTECGVVYPEIRILSDGSGRLVVGIGQKIVFSFSDIEEFFDKMNEKLGTKTELTLEEIAEKFNIPVDKLRIKD